MLQNPIFAGISAELREGLEARSQLRRFAPGERILSEGDPAEHLFVLSSGAVRVFHQAPNGLEVLLKIFRAPALFGESEALAAMRFVENVEAIEPSEVLAMKVGDVLEVLRHDAGAAVAMLTDVATRLVIAAINEKSLAFDPVSIRLANYLLDVASWTNPDGTVAPFVALTQDDMAAALGVTRRAIAKEIADWQEEGILKRETHGYRIKNLEALRRNADLDRRGLTYSLKRDTRG